MHALAETSSTDSGRVANEGDGGGSRDVDFWHRWGRGSSLVIVRLAFSVGCYVKV